jgi:glucan phosphorylase
MELFELLMPRHPEIIFEINRRFLDEVRARSRATVGADTRSADI